MKKLVFVIILLITVMMFTVSFAWIAEEEIIHDPNCVELKKPLIPTFVLPESVEIIEDEAFEGTAIVKIKLPETVTTIGDRAFANIYTLKSINIPNSTTSIAKTAFTGSNNVTITAPPNSYARTWAKEKGLPFSPITVMYAGTGGQSVTGALSTSTKEVFHTEYTETRGINKTWRKHEEIQVHDTIEIIANVIQGRAPPMA